MKPPARSHRFRDFAEEANVPGFFMYPNLPKRLCGIRHRNKFVLSEPERHVRDISLSFCTSMQNVFERFSRLSITDCVKNNRKLFSCALRPKRPVVQKATWSRICVIMYQRPFVRHPQPSWCRNSMCYGHTAFPTSDRRLTARDIRNSYYVIDSVQNFEYSLR